MAYRKLSPSNLFICAITSTYCARSATKVVNCKSLANSVFQMHYFYRIAKQESLDSLVTNPVSKDWFVNVHKTLWKPLNCFIPWYVYLTYTEHNVYRYNKQKLKGNLLNQGKLYLSYRLAWRWHYLTQNRSAMKTHTEKVYSPHI